MDFVSENVFGRSQKTQRKVPNLPNTLYDHFVFWYLRGNYVNFEGVGGSNNAPLIFFFLHIPPIVLILKCWALHRCQMCWHFTVTYYSSQLANLSVSKLFGDWNCFGENSAVCAKSIRMWFETIFSHFVLVCLGWRKANSGPWEQLLANWVCFLISLFVSCVSWSVCFLIRSFLNQFVSVICLEKRKPFVSQCWAAAGARCSARWGRRSSSLWGWRTSRRAGPRWCS